MGRDLDCHSKKISQQWCWENCSDGLKQMSPTWLAEPWASADYKHCRLEAFCFITYAGRGLIFFNMFSNRNSYSYLVFTVRQSLGQCHVCAKLLQSCLTLCDSTDCSPPGFSVHRILQARILEWVAVSFSRGSSQPGDWSYVSYISCIGIGR